MKWILCLLILISLAAAAQAQEQQSLQIPVWITDQNGSPVSAVGKDDLVIHDHGVLRPDFFFDDAGLQSASEFHQSVLILIDSSNINRSGLKNVKESLLSYLKNSPATAFPIAIAETKSRGSYRVIQDYTTDAQLLSAQISKLEKYASSDRAIRAARINQDDRITSDCPGNYGHRRGSEVSGCIDDALRIASTAARVAAREEKTRAFHSWNSLLRVFESAGSVPGYKHIFFLSDGIDLTGSYFLNYGISYLNEEASRLGLSPSRTSRLIKDLQGELKNTKELQEAVQHFAKSANLSATVIHWVNTEVGHSLSTSIESEELSIGESLPLHMEALSDAVYQTGGRVIPGSKKDPAKLLTDLPKLYLIGIPSDNPQSNSGSHEIRIASRNKAFHVFYPLCLPLALEKNVWTTSLSFPDAEGGGRLAKSK